MPKDLDFYRSRLRIDKNNLDAELEEHSFLYQEVGNEMALAISDRDAAKDAAAILYAQLAEDERADDPKLSDTKIKSIVTGSNRYKKALTKLNDTTLEAQYWTVLYESYRARGGMIKHLADLYIANYFTVRTASTEQASAKTVLASHARRARAEKLSNDEE